VLAQGKDVIPIPGTKRRSYLEQNAAAINIKLSSKDKRRIEKIAPRGAASGQRYEEQMMKYVNI
jgi:aryl-alcohol dehydrogenase-like predicted oxidoreductase